MNGNSWCLVDSSIIFLLAMYHILYIIYHQTEQAELSSRVESPGEFLKEPEFEVASGCMSTWGFPCVYNTKISNSKLGLVLNWVIAGLWCTGLAYNSQDLRILVAI